MKDCILKFIWFITFIIVSNIFFAWLSMANSLMNIFGIILMILFIYISIKTDCFSKFTFIEWIKEKINNKDFKF